MTLKTLPVFFLDLQTTGSKPETSSILEIAWGDAERIETYLVAQPPGLSIPYRIQALTGITNEDLAQALPLEDIIEKIKSFIVDLFKGGQKPLAVIHFASFEKPFLSASFKGELPFEIICTHDLAKRLMPNLPSKGIKGLAGYFGFNAGELKRAQSHLEATRVIWRGLTDLLEKENINHLEQLKTWLQHNPKKARIKYEYPLPREKRLSLPDQPGIYRMISQWGEVLYVGKATSLHSRVNSYFRGQKNRDPRKLEMLTQTWDLRVTPCETPLESALMESDEIKRLNPRYNICLKTGKRALVFYNRDFTSSSTVQDEEHHLGPFPNAMVLDSMLKLASSLQQNQFNPQMFFEELDPDLLQAGFQVFCERHGFTASAFSSMRAILAIGLHWHRQETEEDVPEAELDEEELQEENLVADLQLTPEDLADKYERHFLRAGRAYARARQLTKLLNADIEFQIVRGELSRHLILYQGKIQSRFPEAVSKDTFPWKNLSIDTYDRMSILLSELKKITSQNGRVSIHKIFS